MKEYSVIQFLLGIVIGVMLSMMVNISRESVQIQKIYMDTKRNRTIANFDIQENMSPSEKERLTQSYMAQVQFQCPLSWRAGKKTDGGWDVCLLPSVAPSHHCVVFSFGINNDWSFDDAMATKFNCQVRSYDPSMRKGNHSRSENINFFKVGLGAQNERASRGWELRTFGTLLRDQNFHEVDIDYLKFDIDGPEFDVISSMFKEGSLRRVKQLALEVHLGKKWQPEGREAIEIVQLLEDIGFRKWFSHQNQHSMHKSEHTGDRVASCWEMYYVNQNFLLD